MIQNDLLAITTDSRVQIDLLAITTHSRVQNDLLAITTYARVQNDLLAIATYARVQNDLLVITTYARVQNDLLAIATHSRLQNIYRLLLRIKEMCKNKFFYIITSLLHYLTSIIQIHSTAHYCATVDYSEATALLITAPL